MEYTSRNKKAYSSSSNFDRNKTGDLCSDFNENRDISFSKKIHFKSNSQSAERISEIMGVFTPLKKSSCHQDEPRRNHEVEYMDSSVDNSIVQSIGASPVKNKPKEKSYLKTKRLAREKLYLNKI
jgi:hypothetical protein